MMTKQRLQGESGNKTPDLPAIITAIKPQKQHKERYSLFNESTFLTGVSTETLIALNLGRGVTLTPELFRKIELLEQKAGLNAYLLRLLGRRDHARDELETKALKKGYRRPDISEALDKLEEKGYVDDASFARKFIADKLSLGKWGPRKVESELIRRGVNRDIASRALSRIPDNLELREICVDLAVSRRKRFLRETDLRKRKQKIHAFLLQRGFRFETINKALPDILLNLDV